MNTRVLHAPCTDMILHHPHPMMVVPYNSLGNPEVWTCPGFSPAQEKEKA